MTGLRQRFRPVIRSMTVHKRLRVVHPFLVIWVQRNWRTVKKPLNRKDRSPYPRLTLRVLYGVKKSFQLVDRAPVLQGIFDFNLPSSFSAAAGAASAGAAAPPAAGAAAPAPEPMLSSISLISLPSRAFIPKIESAFILFVVCLFFFLYSVCGLIELGMYLGE